MKISRLLSKLFPNNKIPCENNLHIVGIQLTLPFYLPQLKCKFSKSDILPLSHLLLRVIYLFYSHRKLELLFFEYNSLLFKAISLSVFFHLLLRDFLSFAAKSVWGQNPAVEVVTISPMEYLDELVNPASLDHSKMCLGSVLVLDKKIENLSCFLPSQSCHFMFLFST